MDQETINSIISLIKQEVVPAIGCTEPIAVALATAKATEVLGSVPTKIDVLLSANVLKNAMGVGIPGTGMVGLPIAIALGALIGKSSYELEVLKDVTPQSLAEAKLLIENKTIHIAQHKETENKLYVEICCSNGNQSSRVIICQEHTHIACVEKNGETLEAFHLPHCQDSDTTNQTIPLCFDIVYNFSMSAPTEAIRFILQTATINKAAATEALKGKYGHTVAQTVLGKYGKKFLGDTPYTHMLSLTAAACDARMDGAMIQVMSNSGSGNQGIAATLPVLSFAEDINATEEALIRALTISHLMVIYVKQHLGRLSALCGCVVAATGASCAITYLMGGNKDQLAFSIKNMIGNITGMICDGAKPSCAMKVSSGVSTAMLSALMAMENKVVSAAEGIIDEDVDQTIANLTAIGSRGMEETDKLVLDIMTSKSC